MWEILENPSKFIENPSKINQKRSQIEKNTSLERFRRQIAPRSARGGRPALGGPPLWRPFGRKMDFQGSFWVTPLVPKWLQNRIFDQRSAPLTSKNWFLERFWKNMKHIDFLIEKWEFFADQKPLNLWNCRLQTCYEKCVAKKKPNIIKMSLKTDPKSIKSPKYHQNGSPSRSLSSKC